MPAEQRAYPSRHGALLLTNRFDRRALGFVSGFRRCAFCWRPLKIENENEDEEDWRAGACKRDADL